MVNQKNSSFLQVVRAVIAKLNGIAITANGESIIGNMMKSGIISSWHIGIK